MIAKSRSTIEQSGTQLAFVHQSSDADAGGYLAKYGLHNVPRISDPELKLYKTFGLLKASGWSFLDPRSIARAVRAIFLRGHGFGKRAGDEFQLPGAFLLLNGNVLKSHKYKEVWDHPDYRIFAP